MARPIYTPEMLAAAAGLAHYPWDEALPLRGEARSRSCGSMIALALATDTDGRIARVGLRAHACAVGQAAAHAFASRATGLGPGEISAAREAIAAWLAGCGPLPEWQGLDLVAPAVDYPARHGAVLLAWDAALEALSPAPSLV